MRLAGGCWRAESAESHGVTVPYYKGCIMKRNVLLVSALALVSMCHGFTMPVWEVGTITGDTDVISEGTTVTAYAVGGATEVNGVSFVKTPNNGNTSVQYWGTYLTVNIGIRGTRAYSATRGTPSGMSEAYVTMLRGELMAYTDANSTFEAEGVIQLQGLIPGAQYILQVWCNDSSGSSSASRQTMLIANIFDATVTVRQNMEAKAGGAGQYAVLRFTAPATALTIDLTAPHVIGATDAILISAIQLREVAATTPNAYAWSGGVNNVWAADDLNWGGDGAQAPWAVGSGTEAMALIYPPQPTTTTVLRVESTIEAGVVSSVGSTVLQGNGMLNTTAAVVDSDLLADVRVQTDVLQKHGGGVLSFVNPLGHAVGVLAVSNGAVRLSPLPIFGGLTTHLDASDITSMDVDANGGVVAWRSVNGAPARYTFPTADAATFVPPVYAADAFGGRGGVRFGSEGPSKLTSTVTTNARSVFLVMKLSVFKDYQEVWGINAQNSDTIRGIRLWGAGSPNNMKWFTDRGNTTGGNGVLNDEELFWVDGVWSENYPLASTTAAQVLSLQTSGGAVGKYFAMGSYFYASANRTGRYLQGDVAELIVYDRLLSSAERQVIEQYLIAKWAGAERQSLAANILSDSMKVIVEAQGTLSLDGVSQEVSGLSGDGTVAATAPAELVVNTTQDAVFNGAFKGALNVRKQGTAALKLLGSSTHSGMLDIREGSVIAGQEFPTEGLLYRLDAGRPETLTVNASGQVSAWADSQADSTVVFSQANAATQPDYVPSAFNGQGGVRFGAEGKVTSLEYDQSTVNKTVFLVVYTESTTVEFAGVWGSCASGQNVGFRSSGTATSGGYGASNQWGFAKGSSGDFVPDNNNGSFRTNGVAVGNVGPVIPEFEVQVIALNRKTASTFAQTAVGEYYWEGERPYMGIIGEVIVYDRDLTADEFAQVEGLLMLKWGARKETAASHLSSSSGLVMTKGTVLDLKGSDQAVRSYSGAGQVVNGRLIVSEQVTATGDVGIFGLPQTIHVTSPVGLISISGAGDLSTVTVTVDTDSLKIGQRYPILLCDGEFTGLPVVSGVNPDVWMIRRIGDVVELFSKGGMVLQLF